MKITNKENLCKYLQENLINDDRAEVFLGDIYSIE